jgi:hypothetical protein
LLDLSESGARLLLRAGVELGTVAELELAGRGQARSFRVMARVVSCTPAQDGSGFQVGVVFQRKLAQGLLGTLVESHYY